MTPGSKEWYEHVRKLVAEERRHPKRWFYISYADERGFLGAVIVESDGPATANLLTHSMHINPGGEALMMTIPAGLPLPPESMRNRLLSKEELIAFDHAHGFDPPKQEEVDAFADRAKEMN